MDSTFEDRISKCLIPSKALIRNETITDHGFNVLYLIET